MSDTAPAKPMPLDDIERYGATRFGGTLRRVVMIHDDGREVAVDLPRMSVPDSPDDDPDDDLTAKQRAIREVVIATPPGEVISNDDIAKRSGWGNTRDLQDFVRTLAKAGLLKKAYRGWLRV